MPRRKKVSTAVAALEARAVVVEAETVRQTVPLDMQTFDKVVQFIEDEGCTLQEGLRRAVRLGVEALLFERTPATAGRQPDVVSAFKPPNPRLLPLPLAPQSQYVDEIPDDNTIDYAHTAPPGL